MTNTATTTEHDTFCDCQRCVDAQVATIHTLPNNAGPVALDDFTTEDEAAAPVPCRRCHRPLTSQRSIREAQRNGGYGRGCAHKIEQAAKAAATVLGAARVEKATDAIETGAVAQAAPNRFQVVSSDGTQTYDVDLAAGTCTCRAGQFGRHCYHLTSAVLLAA